MENIAHCIFRYLIGTFFLDKFFAQTIGFLCQCYKCYSNAPSKVDKRIFARRWLICATSRKVAGSSPFETNECFSIYLILPAALGPEVYSASNRNEYQKLKNNISGE
jgi:hypothetical protein